MSTLNCSACEELRQDAADFVVNGLTDDICTSLANDTGLSPTSGNNDCTDLNNVADCLIGNMATEVDAYNVCDWKSFMKKFIPNVWTVLKGIICAICGIWTNIHNLWKLADRIDCIVDYMMSGASFSFGENVSGKDSKVIPGTGVDFGIRTGSEQHTNDVSIYYIAGGLARLSGSVRFFTESFKDVHGNTKSGNSMWNFEASDYVLPNGGELIYELRIKKSEYPQIKRLFDGMAFANGSHHQSVEVKYAFFNEGSWAYGQHGWCDDNGEPSSEGYSRGHKVEPGWMYVQARMNYVNDLAVYDVKDGSGATKQGTDLTPSGYLGIRMNQDAIPC